MAAAPAHAAKAPAGSELTVFAGGGSSPDVVYNAVDDEYLVVWNASGTVEGRVVRPDLSGAGAVFSLSQPNRGGAPKAAFDPSRDEYLVVWPGPTGPGNEVLGQRLRANGSEVGADDFPISASGGSVRSVAVADRAGHGEYGVAWAANGSPGAGEVFLRRVGADGQALAGAAQISDPARGLGHSASEPAIAYSTEQDHYLLAWVQNALVEPLQTQIVGRLVGAGDASPDPVIAISGTQQDGGREGVRSGPAVAHRAGGGYLVVWAALYDYIGPWVVGDTVLPSGLVGGGAFSIRYPRLPGPFSTNGSREPALAFDPPSGEFEVVWRGATTLGAESADEIFGVTRYDGTDPFQVSGAGGLHYDASQPAIAYDRKNQEHLVVWTAAGSPGVGLRILARRLARVGGEDVHAPRVRVGIGRRQRIVRQRGLVIRARCDEPCTLSATAALPRPGASRAIVLTPAFMSLPARTTARLRLRAGRRALRSLRHAFRHRRRLGVRVTVTASDQAGNARTIKRRARARR